MMSAAPDSYNIFDSEAHLKSIFEWLTLPRDQITGEDAAQLYRQLMLLRDTPLPAIKRLELLELFYAQAKLLMQAEIPNLHKTALPISRKLRQNVKHISEFLETLAQDYINLLAELFDPEISNSNYSPQISLLRAINAIAWQIHMYQLVAAPPRLGLWQQMHATFRSATRLGLEKKQGPEDEPSPQQIYSETLLSAIAHPASFSSIELEFVGAYIKANSFYLDFDATPLPESKAIFWIDPEKDFSAHALIRRIPGAESQPIFFSCELAASEANKHYSLINEGAAPSTLGLPDFASTSQGLTVLQRLTNLWGNPTKRRFTRRHQSYRAKLCFGLENLWQLLKMQDAHVNISEWMVTNESPDGFALMHISGYTDKLFAGDVVALQAYENLSEGISPKWHICIVRWAISENPEHIELGLQLLAKHASAVEIAQPGVHSYNCKPALILPETPPFHPDEMLVAPQGVIKENNEKIFVLSGEEQVSIREMRTTGIDEETGSVQIFSVSKDNSS